MTTAVSQVIAKMEDGAKKIRFQTLSSTYELEIVGTNEYSLTRIESEEYPEHVGEKHTGKCIVLMPHGGSKYSIALFDGVELVKQTSAVQKLLD